MKPTKCPAKEKKEGQQKRKKRGGEKRKVKVKPYCVTFKTKNHECMKFFQAFFSQLQKSRL